MAATRFRFGDDFTPADYQETEGLPAEARERILLPPSAGSRGTVSAASRPPRSGRAR